MIIPFTNILLEDIEFLVHEFICEPKSLYKQLLILPMSSVSETKFELRNKKTVAKLPLKMDRLR